MSNLLKDESSPYLLQHANNPVNWYPWCKEAFELAKSQDKPIFLSIGYSTCHWCHVMAHESFIDESVAKILNEHFISIKVDKEERPDIDSIYMSVCQAFTGSGGWPMSIFMTPDQKPFFAGTYFPKTARYGSIGFIDLLLIINKKWKTEKDTLIKSAEDVISNLEQQTIIEGGADFSLIDSAVKIFKQNFDENFGGFGDAPKFPTPHNLLFLMSHYKKSKDTDSLNMVEKTLTQLYRGGIFDHIGYGFCRYSTDKYFLAPHFEKMLYDNALLIIAYCKAYSITKNSFYRNIAKKTAEYILREMTDKEGGFYSAQDADSDGIEGKYYVFEPSEIVNILGYEIGTKFNQYYSITSAGNFEGKSIPNLLDNTHYNGEYEAFLRTVYEYRKKRNHLHLDDKILTAWNSLMICAMCNLYRITEDKTYLDTAFKAQIFIEKNLSNKDTLYVSFRNGKQGKKGFLDDYASYVYALLSLYESTLDKVFLDKAICFCDKSISQFWDKENGGFFLYGKENEQLIYRPKESYDGAIPSGNSIMAYNLLRLFNLTRDEKYNALAKRQLDFMSFEAKHYPSGYAMFLTTLSDYILPPDRINVVLKDINDLKDLVYKIPLDFVFTIFEKPTKEYPLINDKTTYYVCKNNSCLPPANELESFE